MTEEIVPYNVSDLIPIPEFDLPLWKDGSITGVYYHSSWEGDAKPTHYIVTRAPYFLNTSWDYMDVRLVTATGDIVTSMVVRGGYKKTVRKFNNLVAKLSDPNHDIMAIKRSYF